LGLIPDVVFVQSAPASSGEPNVPGIVNGQKANPGEFPWMASIQSQGSNWHGCGASIIAPGWILTAAHCVINQQTGQVLPTKYEIVVGLHDRRDTRNARRHPVSKVIVHPKIGREGWNVANADVDIALMKLATPIALGGHIQAAALPEANAPVSGIGVFSGWGGTKAEEAHELRKFSAPIKNYPECVRQRSIYQGQTNMFCTDYSTTYHWYGDSGSPMVSLNGGKATQIGICAYWGPDLSPQGASSTYVQVSKYIGWIQETMRNNP